MVYSFDYMAYGISGFLGPLFIFVVDHLKIGGSHATFPFLIVYLIASFLAFVSIVICIFTKEEKFYYD